MYKIKYKINYIQRKQVASFHLQNNRKNTPREQHYEPAFLPKNSLPRNALHTLH